MTAFHLFCPELRDDTERETYSLSFSEALKCLPGLLKISCVFIIIELKISKL